MKRNTKQQLLDKAEVLFSEKGFYGTSINDVAAEVSVSKQGLLHHFPSKEKLYGAVLQQAADKLLALVEQVKQEQQQAPQQLRQIIFLMGTCSDQLLRVITLLMRELLDNRERADNANQWFLRPFLDEMVAIASGGQQQKSKTDALAFIYQLLGATQYYLISQPTLKKLYSTNEFEQHQQRHLALLEQQIEQHMGSDNR